MMTCIFSSSPCVEGELKLNPANGFIEELRRAIPAGASVLFICSDPDDPPRTDRFAEDMRRCFVDGGFVFSSFRVLDGRNRAMARALIAGSDLLILAGGHVPTQNRFFQEIGLRRLLRGFDGAILGISAGSMNAADVVYAQPERPGEALDPTYRRFLSGLGLTDKRILPHLNEIREDVLDGLRLFEDITFPDSVGHAFYAIPDGSYLLIRDGREEWRGEVWRVENGSMTLLQE